MTNNHLNPTTVCAWCNVTMRPGHPDHGITHGVCEPCAAAVLADDLATRAGQDAPERPSATVYGPDPRD